MDSPPSEKTRLIPKGDGSQGSTGHSLDGSPPYVDARGSKTSPTGSKSPPSDGSPAGGSSPTGTEKKPGSGESSPQGSGSSSGSNSAPPAAEKSQSGRSSPQGSGSQTSRSAPTCSDQSPGSGKSSPQGSGSPTGGVLPRNSDGSSPASSATTARGADTSPQPGTSKVYTETTFQYVTPCSRDNNSSSSSKYSPWAGIVLVLILGLAFGFMAGWFGRYAAENSLDFGKALDTKGWLLKEIKAENIRENLKRFTSYPHLAGTSGEQRLADDLEAMWTQQGLDHVTQEQYDVLLSYPNPSDPSVVELLDQTGRVLFRSQIQEKNLTADQNQPDIVMPYSSHSPAGDVRGALVFVNYGRIEDFQYLRDEFNVNLTGSIAIVKYGEIFSADKATFAAQFGCQGLIIYSDPAEYNQGPEAPFPSSWWLPDTGVQRGAMYALKGDPITPGYPSIASAYRWPEDQVAGLPQIPVHPISYADAEKLLLEMAGPAAPKEWQGGLALLFRIGTTMRNNRTVHLRVTNTNQRAYTSNVFGYITGSVEPDRYVLLGNHRDAWVFGGVDPNSGTAVMMEVSRAFSVLMKEGWRPRRTIIFCSWGAEEMGLMGSTEWVENYVKNLGNRAVIYINVDSAVSGNKTFSPAAVPIMHNALYEAAKQISSPNNPAESMYDEWLQILPDPVSGKPKVGALGAGSDYAGFINMAGVSSMDLHYKYDPKFGLSSSPCHHSAYDTFFMFDNYIDPDYKYSHAMAQLTEELVRYYAESPLLAVVNVSLYYDALSDYADQLQTFHGQRLAYNKVSLADLRAAVEMFGEQASDFEQRLAAADTKDDLAVRMLNDQLMQVERAFIDPHGVPQQTLYKHLISAPSKFNSSAGSAFPGLTNLLFDVDTVADPAARWEEVRGHLATLVFTVQSAASTLAPVDAFN